MDVVDGENANESPRSRVLVALRHLLVTTIFILVGSAIVASILLSHGRKQLHRGLTVISRDLLRYEMADTKADDQEGPRVFVLNGQEIEVETGHEQASVDEIMSDMSGDCHRIDEGEESHQTCMQDGSTLADLQGLVTGEAIDMRRLKYRYAVGDDEGSFYVNLTPKTDFDPSSLWSRTEDAPGPDHSDIPRPPDARRTISAHERGRPYLASMFLGSQDMSPRELKTFYRENMSSAVWTETELSDDPDDFVVFRRNGAPDRFVTITFHRADSDARGIVTVVAEAQ